MRLDVSTFQRRNVWTFLSPPIAGTSKDVEDDAGVVVSRSVETVPSPPAEVRARDRRRRRTLLGGLLLLSMAGGAVAAEATVRLMNPVPRIQIVRRPSLRELHGVPVWSEMTDGENLGCAAEHPERIRVAFFGTSITYGSGTRYPTRQSFAAKLEDLLNAARPTPGFCVLNFSQPAFHAQQEAALALEHLPSLRPALAFFEVWDPSPYFFVGNAAYSDPALVLRRNGVPGLRGVPDAPNRWLFAHSRVYERLVLRFGVRDRRPRYPSWEAWCGEMAALAARSGARPVFYVPTFLDHGFDVSGEEALNEAVVAAFTRASGAASVSLREMLQHEDFLRIRADSCCHYNDAGHRTLAEAFSRLVLDLLRAGRAGAQSQRMRGRTPRGTPSMETDTTAYPGADGASRVRT